MDDLFFLVSHCNTTKEICDTLQFIHEGTSKVEMAKMDTLVHEYELFKIEPGKKSIICKNVSSR